MAEAYRALCKWHLKTGDYRSAWTCALKSAAMIPTAWAICGLWQLPQVVFLAYDLRNT